MISKIYGVFDSYDAEIVFSEMAGANFLFIIAVASVSTKNFGLYVLVSPLFFRR
ncbi:hypothetical protein [Lysinibacillus sp. RC46]|uniref:hypothetical protein n=1 Tax=unclassified Lysinibacillus TaxID=2636778 RepID=UPI00351639FC